MDRKRAIHSLLVRPMKVFAIFRRAVLLRDPWSVSFSLTQALWRPELAVRPNSRICSRCTLAELLNNVLAISFWSLVEPAVPNGSVGSLGLRLVAGKPLGWLPRALCLDSRSNPAT